MITRINESKILTKHVSWKGECNFDSKECSLNKKWNNDKGQYEYKNLAKRNVCKEGYI